MFNQIDLQIMLNLKWLKVTSIKSNQEKAHGGEELDHFTKLAARGESDVAASDWSTCAVVHVCSRCN